jgi:hypothetical protein
LTDGRFDTLFDTQFVPPVIEELKVKARKLGLWNFFLHKGYAEGPGFTNLEYAVLCEIIGKCHLAAEVKKNLMAGYQYSCP